MAALAPGDFFSFDLRIVPNAPKNAVERASDGTWKVRIHAPAVDGKANDALVKFLAKDIFHVTISSVVLVRGEKNRNKTVRIALNAEAAIAALNAAAERR